MSIIQSLILGAVQGVTEFLPVSSFGHLVILQYFMQIEEVPILYDILLHAATLCVVIFTFRRRVLRMVLALLQTTRRQARAEEMVEVRTVGIILLGTAVTAAFGLGVRALGVEGEERVVFALFLVTALLLIMTRFIQPERCVDEPGVREGLIIGAAQGLGTLPGISRSGITICAALWSGVPKEKVGELSFLFSIPAITGALLLELVSGGSGEPVRSIGLLNIAAGMAAAAAAGFFSLRMLMAVIRSRRLYLFSIYLIPLGIAGLILTL